MAALTKYNLGEHSRPYWQDKSICTEIPIAKIKFSPNNKAWQLFWQRANGRWIKYPNFALTVLMSSSPKLIWIHIICFGDETFFDSQNSFHFFSKEIVLPPGDAQRAWFPEMITSAKKRWSEDMAWKDIIRLCSDMQDLRDRIRRERQIKPARMFCPKCGKYTLSTPLKISPRSLLFMLVNENVITEDVFKKLDKDWKKYRKTHNLDAFGNESDKIDKKQISCAH